MRQRPERKTKLAARRPASPRRVNKEYCLYSVCLPDLGRSTAALKWHVSSGQTTGGGISELSLVGNSGLATVFVYCVRLPCSSTVFRSRFPLSPTCMQVTKGQKTSSQPFVVAQHAHRWCCSEDDAPAALLVADGGAQGNQDGGAQGDGRRGRCRPGRRSSRRSRPR